MTADTLTEGFLTPHSDISPALARRHPPLDDDEDDRDVTAITALEISAHRTSATLAKLRGEIIPAQITSINEPTPTPTPIPTNQDKSTWATRAIYNNSVFDIGMALTLTKNQPLNLEEAVLKTVNRNTGISKVNIILVEGALDITSAAGRHRTLDSEGTTVSFSKHNTDFNTVELIASSRKTRLLIMVWRPHG